MRGLVVIGLFVCIAGCNGPAGTPVSVASSPSAPVAVVSARPTLSSPTPSNPPTDWTSLRWSAPAQTVPGARISDVLTQGGTYIAVGQVQDANGRTQAAAWVSTDWRSWTRTLLDVPRVGDSTHHWVLRFGSGLIGVGSSGLQHCQPPPGEGQVCSPVPTATWTSSDGTTWQPEPSAPTLAQASIAAVALGSGGIVLVGATGWDAPGIWTSTDGRVWRRENLPSAVFAHAHFRGLADGPNGLILTGATGGAPPVCCAGSTGATTPAAWTSTDGQTWQAASVIGAQGSIGDGLSQVFIGGAGAIATGWNEDAPVWQSSDGRQWSPLPGQNGIPVQPLASDGERILGHSFLAPNGAAFWLSGDGAIWHPLTMAGQTDEMPGWSAPGSSANDAYLYSGGVGLVGDNGSTSQPLWFAQGQ